MPACDRTVVIQGVVTDVAGEGLPGVAITVRGRLDQAVSDGVGRYSLRSAPGAIDLELMKTGYTPGYLSLHVARSGAVAVTPAVLWPLPQDKGVYLFENFRYRELTRIEPMRYLPQDVQIADARKGPLFGTKQEPECDTLDTEPLLICHRLPPYDVRLCRLRQVKAALIGENTAAAPLPDAPAPGAVAPVYTEMIWVPADDIPTTTAPIDEPNKLLVELKLSAPLEPGTYAAHWGALNGYTSIDAYAYLFRVGAPEEPALESVPPDAETSEDASAPKGDTPPAETAPLPAQQSPKADAATQDVPGQAEW